MLSVSYPMSQSLGEATFNVMVCLEKLVGEVLGHEGKHQVGSLGVWPKFGSFKETLSQLFRIRKNSFTWKDRNVSRFPQKFLRNVRAD